MGCRKRTAYIQKMAADIHVPGHPERCGARLGQVQSSSGDLERVLVARNCETWHDGQPGAPLGWRRGRAGRVIGLVEGVDAESGEIGGV